MGWVAKLCHFLSLANLLGTARMERKPAGGNSSHDQGPKQMKKQQADLTRALLKEASRVLVELYPRRISRCLKLLSEEEIWWRPNSASNSVGNMVLHLQGNVRQWIIAGMGGEADRRVRDREFAERGPIPRRILLAGMRSTIKEAQVVLADLSRPDIL